MTPSKVFWVFAHPEPASLSGSLMREGVAHLRAKGHSVALSDLYGMRWNPIASADDFPQRNASERLFYMSASKAAFEESAQAEEIAREQEKLQRCDVLIVQFPFWWFGMPAILKGWFDRVFANGFAYGLSDPEWPSRSLRYGKGGLAGRRAMIITTAAARATALGPRGVAGSIDDLLFPIHHGLFWYTGMGALPPFVVYSAGRVSEGAFPHLFRSLAERLDELGTAPVIPYRYQNSSDYDDDLALMPGLEGDKRGFAIHLRRDAMLPPRHPVGAQGAFGRFNEYAPEDGSADPWTGGQQPPLPSIRRGYLMEHHTHNMRLLANDKLRGFGNLGEGVSLQLNGGRRILWMAHESAPKNFTGVDVTDPKNPKVVVQTDLPHKNVRSNSLEVCGDIMAVAYQVSTHGLKPAGIELFDISTPEEPKSISFFDCSGRASRGVHQLWFVDGNTIHCATGTADFIPHDLLDDQIYMAIDVSDPTKPRELGRWWYPGTRVGDSAPRPPRHPKFDSGWRAHNTNVYPDVPDRAYVAYLDGGAFVLDISDQGNPKVVSHWNPHPPFPGFTHTVMPLPERNLLVVTDECVEDDGLDWPKLVWLLDYRDANNPVPISTLPIPPIEEHAWRGGRYGAHNLHENRPGPSFNSSSLLVGSYFNGGIRAHDITDPFQPQEVAFFVPANPKGSPVRSIQINDVYVDENRIVYGVDRFVGGLYILEMTI